MIFLPHKANPDAINNPLRQMVKNRMTIVSYDKYEIRTYGVIYYQCQYCTQLKIRYMYM